MHKNNYNLIKNQFNKNAKKLHTLDFIYREIATRMISRLNYIKITPSEILDIGSGLNIDAELLQKKFPKAKINKLDIAIEVLKLNYKKSGFLGKLIHKNNELICANAMALPIASQSINLVWSNLTLPYIDDLNSFLMEINRVLTINGTLLISGLAVDSLRQLRDVGLRTYDFPDMHIIGDMLLKTGFANPVTDVEYITLEYDNVDQLLQDIKIIGCGAVQSMPMHMTKTEYLYVKEKFMQITKNGIIPLTLEIFYAHAWKDKVTIPLEHTQSIIQFHP